MLIDVAKLPDEPLFLEVTVPWQDLKFVHQDARLRQDVDLKLRITLIEQQMIRVQGNCSTALEFTCSRCLQGFSQPEGLRFDLYYVPHGSVGRGSEEIELKDEDMELGFYDGVQLDTDLVLAEQLVFAVPMKPLCRSSCKGLCPECGANLNTNPCGCQPRGMNPLQEKLQAMKNHLEGKKK